MKCPCKGCLDRQLRCHSECEGYTIYKTEIEKARDNRAREQIYWDSHFMKRDRFIKSIAPSIVQNRSNVKLRRSF